VATADTVADAFDDLVRTAPAGVPRRIVIFGSLYLAGTVLADHG
jgi:folylpolyglutamate synthase/dihydropteroate synthase